MTGFGIGDASVHGCRLVVEARSLNHKFLELRVRLPAELSDQAFYFEQLARARLARGRYDLSVQLERTAPAPGLDLDRARAVYAALKALRDEVAPGTELPVTALASVPELFSARGGIDTEALRQGLEQALSAALRVLDVMREKEGAALGQELAARLATTRELTEELSRAVPDAAKRQATRLRERVARLVSDTSAQVDAGRLETEIALLSDRADVTEELVRLASHIAQFEGALAESEPIGRRLDFLLQEMNRETNTIGAKCQDATLAQMVIELKAELSRMREQVQNVE